MQKNIFYRSIISLQKQIIKDIDIILVKDGSKYKSISICQQYANNDSRIKVIDKENGRVSYARKAGV